MYSLLLYSIRTILSMYSYDFYNLFIYWKINEYGSLLSLYSLYTSGTVAFDLQFEKILSAKKFNKNLKYNILKHIIRPEFSE